MRALGVALGEKVAAKMLAVPTVDVSPQEQALIGAPLADLLINYFLEILGSLWRDVAWSQQYSLFHHFYPGNILTGKTDAIDLLILAVAITVPVAYALVVFPRRDLAAPS